MPKPTLAIWMYCAPPPPAPVDFGPPMIGAPPSCMEQQKVNLRRFFFSLPLAITSVWASTANAWVIDCNTCTKATAAQAAMVGEGRFVVANFETGEAWAFHSSIAESHTDREGVFEVLRWSVTPTSLTEAEKAELPLLSHVWRMNNRSFKFHIVVQPGSPGYPDAVPANLTAFGVVQVGSNQNSLGRALVSNEFTRSLPTEARNQIAALNSAMMSSRVADVAEVRITVVFRDYSRVDFMITPSTTQKAQYVLGSAEDRGGRPIPDRWESVGDGGADQWIFDRYSDFQNMVNHFRQGGIAFHDPNGLGNGGVSSWWEQVGPDHQVRMTCIHDGGGTAIKCTIEIIPVLAF